MRIPHNRAILFATAATALVATTVLVVVNPASAAEARVGLGTAGSFAVLAGAGVTNTGPSAINGNLGTCPTPAVTGFPPGVVTGGSIHAADATACGAKSDLTTAYNDAAGRPPSTTYSGPTNLGGTTLVAGVYRSPSSLSVTGTLTLDGQGDGNAVFIFQAGSTLITAPNSSVSFINGSQACNVFWKVGSSATLGVGSTMVGSVLASESITANTNATVRGRLLARNGAVTLDSNRVSTPGCVTAPTTTSSPSTTLAPTTTSPPTTTVGPTTTIAGPTTTIAGPTTTIATPTTVVTPTTIAAGPTTTMAGPTTTVAGPTPTVAPLAVVTTTTLPLPVIPVVPVDSPTVPVVPLATPITPTATPAAPVVTPAAPVITPVVVAPAAPVVAPAAPAAVKVSPYAPIVVAPRATAKSAPAVPSVVLSTPTVGVSTPAVTEGIPTAGELPRTGGAAIWFEAFGGLLALVVGGLMRRWAN